MVWSRRITTLPLIGIGALTVGGANAIAEGFVISQPLQEKAAAQWTVEERLSARRRHFEALRAKGAPLQIDGSTTPELLLPIELFRRFMFIGFHPDTVSRDIVRADMTRRANQAGVQLPKDFWDRAEDLGSAYLTTLREVERLGRQTESATHSERPRILGELKAQQEIQRELCGSTLERTRAAFEGGFLDRFLYAAVAPTMFVRFVGDEPDPGSPKGGHQ